MKKQIEVEFRSMLSKQKHDSLKIYFDKKAKYLGQDDKDVYFYIFSDKLLKVTDNVTKKTAKLTLKLNRIGQGSSFEEIEFPIDPINVGKAVKMFNSLEITEDTIHSFQTRHNYSYKGVELALKYSSEWKHHLELEIVVHNLSQKYVAENKIKELAGELNIKIMTEEELKDFVKEIESQKRKERESVK